MLIVNKLCISYSTVGKKPFLHNILSLSSSNAVSLFWWCRQDIGSYSWVPAGHRWQEVGVGGDRRNLGKLDSVGVGWGYVFFSITLDWADTLVFLENWGETDRVLLNPIYFLIPHTTWSRPAAILGRASWPDLAKAVRVWWLLWATKSSWEWSGPTNLNKI